MFNIFIKIIKQSLGFPEDSPTLNKDLQTVLRYVNGSQCPENPAKTISSNFTFICHNNNQVTSLFRSFNLNFNDKFIIQFEIELYN